MTWFARSKDKKKNPAESDFETLNHAMPRQTRMKPMELDSALMTRESRMSRAHSSYEEAGWYDYRYPTRKSADRCDDFGSMDRNGVTNRVTVRSLEDSIREVKADMEKDSGAYQEALTGQSAHSFGNSSMRKLPKTGRLSESSASMLTAELKKHRELRAKLQTQYQQAAKDGLKSSLEKIENAFRNIDLIFVDGRDLEIGDLRTFDEILSELRSNVHARIRWESFYSDPIVDPIDKDEVERKISESVQRLESAVRRADFRDKVYRRLQAEAVGQILPEGFKRSLDGMLDDLSAKDILIHHPKVHLGEGERALEIKPGSGVYRIPFLALHLQRWRNAHSAVNAEGLTDADMETAATLLGGDAYPTLERAVESALALR